MKTLKQKLEEWFEIMAYAGSAEPEPETGFRITGYKLSWLENFTQKRKNRIRKTLKEEK